MTITDTVLAVTYRCNARCTMCDIWKSHQSKAGELEPEYYERLPSSLRNINVSGGEPFLRQDLADVIGAIGRGCPGARMVISTNGLAPALMERSLKSIVGVNPDIGIRFSLDGIGEVHQRMRGIEKAFEKVMASLDIAMALGVKDVGLSYTASEANLDQLLPVYELAKLKKVTFTLCGVAHVSQIEGYLGSEVKEIEDMGLLGKQLNTLIRERLLQWRPEALARAYYEFGIYRREVDRQRILPCGAAEVLFYMDPFGNVFSCNVANKLLGNIRENDFETMWNSKEASDSRDFARDCPYQCWMLCTVSPYLKQRPVRPMEWIARNKIKVLFGRDVIPQ